MPAPTPNVLNLKSTFETRTKPTTAPPPHRSSAGDPANMARDTKSSRPVPAPAMKQPVTIDYASPGLQPPVYVFTNLSEPAWEAVEMEARQKGGGEFGFWKTFTVEQGEYQYKFRLGPGDWWVYDECRPTVEDGAGNRNNLVCVKGGPGVVEKEKDGVLSDIHAPAPLLKHETFVLDTGAASQQTPEHEAQDPHDDEVSPDDESPMMRHETFADGHSESEDSSSSSCSSSEEEPTSPLLRHESATPHSAEQAHAPLFRHESIALGYNAHEPPAANISPVQPSTPPQGPAEANPLDPSLEKFPTDRHGILAAIRRTETVWDEDLTAEGEVGSPRSSALSGSGSSVPPLPEIREAEEEEVEIEEVSGEEMDPLVPGVAGEDGDAVVVEVEVQEVIVVEVMDRRGSKFDVLVDRVGGGRNAVAFFVGIMMTVVGVYVAGVL